MSEERHGALCHQCGRLRSVKDPFRVTGYLPDGLGEKSTVGLTDFGRMFYPEDAAWWRAMAVLKCDECGVRLPHALVRLDGMVVINGGQ